MILYVLKQNNNPQSRAYGKWFAYPEIRETITLDMLADHMSSHHSPYSEGAIKVYQRGQLLPRPYFLRKNVKKHNFLRPHVACLEKI